MRLPAPAPFLVALSLLAGTPAEAKIPDPRWSTIPDVLTGSPAGALLPSCGAPGRQPGQRIASFRVVLRDINNAPLPYVPVVLDLSKTSCRVYADDRSGTTVDCAARQIRRVTDLQGVVEFAPRFSGGCTEALAMVMTDGWSMRDIPARSTDLDLDGRTGLLDFSVVARNFLDGSPDVSTDFDPCAGEPGRTSLADLNVFAGTVLQGGVGLACP